VNERSAEINAVRSAAAQAERSAEWAKAALRRLAQQRLEPTPQNYARAYAEEAGQPLPGAVAAGAAPAGEPSGAEWVALLERLARQLDRGTRQWTPARRKDSVQRVLQGSRSDPQRLLQRLQSLVAAWDGEGHDADQPQAVAEPAGPGAAPATAASGSASPSSAAASSAIDTPGLELRLAAARALHGSVQAGLAVADPRASSLAQALENALATLDPAGDQGRMAEAGQAAAAPLADLQALCLRASSFFGHRHHLVEQLSALCRELAAGITDLAEDESWARGQGARLQACLGADDGGASASVRAVRAATELLAETRLRHSEVREQRQAAQAAIKSLITRMIGEAGSLGEQAGRYEATLGRHAQAIASADSLQSLAGVVQALLDDSQAVQAAVGATRVRLQEDEARAQALQSRVEQLEGELRRLSDEVATDTLTQVANRRGLMQAFERLASQAARTLHEAADPAASEGDGPALAVALLDIDNFKKLNDTLGHAAGDQALKSLAAAVRERLRPVDHLARFGGEEFVVLLPETPLREAQQTLTRLQRSLSAGLFMHEGRDVLVTFSAGVTAWQAGEPLDAALERADQALYEAKRTGKNRTCMA
jgi:diguanylate cyclase